MIIKESLLYYYRQIKIRNDYFRCTTYYGVGDQRKKETYIKLETISIPLNENDVLNNGKKVVQVSLREVAFSCRKSAEINGITRYENFRKPYILLFFVGFFCKIIQKCGNYYYMSFDICFQILPFLHNILEKI